jgi:hypothetical protein
MRDNIVLGWIGWECKIYYQVGNWRVNVIQNSRLPTLPKIVPVFNYASRYVDVRVVEVRFHVFLTPALNGGVCSASRLGCIRPTPGAWTLGIHWIREHKTPHVTDWDPWLISHLWQFYIFWTVYRGADKSLARPGRKQATATEDFEFPISYLLPVPVAARSKT